MQIPVRAQINREVEMRQIIGFIIGGIIGWAVGHYIVWPLMLDKLTSDCPKIVYEIKGDAVLSRDCNESEFIWTPKPYGTNRVYKIGDEIE
jgi:hypothetical protein